MRKALLLLAITAMALGASAQSLTHHTMLWDSVQREYILHVPDNMDTAQPRGMAPIPASCTFTAPPTQW